MFARRFKKSFWVFVLVSVALTIVACVTKGENLKAILAGACVVSIWFASFGIIRTRDSAQDEKKPSKP